MSEFNSTVTSDANIEELRRMCQDLKEKNEKLDSIVKYLSESLTSAFNIVRDMQTEIYLQRHYIMGLMDPNVDMDTYISLYDRYMKLLNELATARNDDWDEHKKERTSIKKHEKEFFEKLEAEKKALTEHRTPNPMSIREDDGNE